MSIQTILYSEKNKENYLYYKKWKYFKALDRNSIL